MKKTLGPQKFYRPFTHPPSLKNLKKPIWMLSGISKSIQKPRNSFASPIKSLKVLHRQHLNKKSVVICN